MRCFLAIELSTRAREHLNRVQEGLRVETPKASFPRVENLHVTVKFLGDVTDNELAVLCESMQHVKVDGALSLTADKLDFFPLRGPARIAVASMSGSEQVVAALHHGIEQRCRKLGFAAENRKYRPHVTLARMKSGLGSADRRRAVQALDGHWPGPRFEVSQFALFESQLSAEGSRYIRLAAFDLTAGGRGKKM